MNKKIPQTDPHASYINYKDEIDEAIRRVLDSGWYILGKEVSSFETEFAQWCGVQNAIGVGSGTDALVLALKTIDVGPGDVVMTVSHTAVATVAAIELVGAVPFLVDVDSDTYTISPNKIIDALNYFDQARGGREKIKVIIPVHLYGHPADMDPIMSIANENRIYIIEDCAQSHGALYKGKKVGTFGHLSEFSFYPTKNLGALGDGGALVVNDSSLYDRAKALREYGWKKRYVSELPGMNSRLDEIQAAVLRVKLKYLDKDNIKRRQIAEIYNGTLATVKIPYVNPDVEHVYHQYVIRVDERINFQKYLNEKGVATSVHYPVPVHLQDAYRGRINTGEMHVTEEIMSDIISLPMFPQLDGNKIDRIVGLIEGYRKC